MKKLLTLLLAGIIPVIGNSQNNVLHFDGVNDYISTNVIQSNSTFSNWTIECWVYGTSSPNYGSYSGPVYGDVMGIIWNHGNPSFAGAATVTDAGGNFYAASFGNIYGGAWYHLAATYDGTNLRAYRNGTLITTTLTSGGMLSNSSPLLFGKHPTLSNFFGGNIDEVRIWTTARTNQELINNKDVELTGSEADLYAYYNFNQGTPGADNSAVSNLIDAGPNSLHATFNGFALNGSTSNFLGNSPADVGARKNALKLDGSIDHLSTNIVFTSSQYGSWTVECWTKPGAPVNPSNYDGPVYGDNLGIIYEHNSLSQPSAMVQGANGNFYFAAFGTLDITKWHHLAATYDGNVLRAYTNGVLITSVTVPGGGLTSGVNQLKIGKHPTVSNYYNGIIDEVRIWNVARTCSEIGGSMNSELDGNETGLQAYYNFNVGLPNSDNTSISMFNDSSANNHNATIVAMNMTGFTSNLVDGAPLNNVVPVCDAVGLNFDGNYDYVTTPLVPSNTTFQNWTIETWIKCPQSPLTNNANGPVYADNMAIIYDHFNVQFAGAACVKAASGTYYTASFGTLSPGNWYHLVATYNGTQLKSYKNGLLMNTTTTTGGMEDNTTPITLGAHPILNYFINGTLDEVRIWNVERSCSEINSTMNTELVGNESGLMAYYKFNEGIPESVNSITTAIDHSGNGNNGTLNFFTQSGANSNYVNGSPRNLEVNSSCPFSIGVNEQLSNDASWVIYPNPAQNQLYVQSVKNVNEFVAEIYSIEGKQVTLQKLDTSMNSVSLETLNSGFYTVKITEGKNVSFMKFIKQ